MSGVRYDGGPAFPGSAVFDPPREQVNAASAYGADTGMSLRDYFAAKAMQGALANKAVVDNMRDDREFARQCYATADAMLKARSA